FTYNIDDAWRRKAICHHSHDKFDHDNEDFAEPSRPIDNYDDIRYRMNNKYYAAMNANRDQLVTTRYATTVYSRRQRLCFYWRAFVDSVSTMHVLALFSRDLIRWSVEHGHVSRDSVRLNHLITNNHINDLLIQVLDLSDFFGVMFADHLHAYAILLLGISTHLIMAVYNYWNRIKLSFMHNQLVRGSDCGYEQMTDEYLRLLAYTGHASGAQQQVAKLRLLYRLTYQLHLHNINSGHHHMDTFNDRYVSFATAAGGADAYAYADDQTSGHRTVSFSRRLADKQQQQQGQQQAIERLERELMLDEANLGDLDIHHMNEIIQQMNYNDPGGQKGITNKAYIISENIFYLAMIPAALVFSLLYYGPELWALLTNFAIDGQLNATKLFHCVIIMYHVATISLMLILHETFFIVFHLAHSFKVNLFQVALEELRDRTYREAQNNNTIAMFELQNPWAHQKLRSLPASRLISKQSIDDVVIQLTRIYAHLLRSIQHYDELERFPAGLLCGWSLATMINSLIHVTNNTGFTTGWREEISFSILFALYVVVVLSLMVTATSNVKIDRMQAIWLSLAAQASMHTRLAIIHNIMPMYRHECVFGHSVMGKRLSKSFYLLTTVWIISGVFFALKYGL
ncbi:hypothetical protein GZH46_03063, partial [Fragariocoptes setiger]